MLLLDFKEVAKCSKIGLNVGTYGHNVSSVKNKTHLACRIEVGGEKCIETTCVCAPGDLGDRKTLVLVIGNRKGSSKQKMLQRSWETFPPKKKNYDPEYYGGRGYRESGSYSVRASSSQDGRHSLERSSRVSRDKGREPTEGVLRKADSFEGHEEAVRTLVAAVHQTRTQQLQQSRKAKSAGHVSN